MKNNVVSCYFILTENCNLRCTYCFENNTRCLGKNMSEEVALKTIDYLFKNAEETNEKEVRITFFGGEPMMNIPLMTTMLRYATKREKETGIDAKMHIITNGTIFNDEVEAFLEEWAKLKKNKVDIQLSVDGTPEIQNINRPCANKNLVSSELVEDCIKKYQDFYKKHKISRERLHVHTCISKASMPKLYEIYKYFIYDLKVEFKFAWVYEEPWDDNDIEIFDKQMSMIYADMIRKNRDIKKFPFKRFDKCSGCSSGRRLICVDTKGDIYPCHRFFFYNLEKRGDYILGNILDENPIDEERRKLYTEIDMSKITNDPCQVCIAVNTEYAGNWWTLPNTFNIRFMEVINKYYYMYAEHDEKQNLLKCINTMVDTITSMSKDMDNMKCRIKDLESDVYRLTNAQSRHECKCNK